jgi:molybdopterin-guanine dinucleotide biosynthesis protein A
VADLPQHPLPQRDEITGLVLAGGRGQRVGGRDKGLIDFNGVPLALQALERLRPQVASVLISANRNAAVYAQWAPVIADDPVQCFAGPLAGIDAAFRASKTPWLAVVPCDLPQLPADAIARLAHALGAARAAHAASDGRHALICLLHRDLGPALRQLLLDGERRIGAMYAALHAVAVPFAASELVNLNAPSDLAAHGGGQ